MLKSRKARLVLTMIFLGATMLAVGCAGESTPSSQPSSSTTPPATQGGSPTTSKTTTSSTTPAAATSKTNTTSTTSQAAAATPRVTKWSTAPEMQIDKSKQYYAVFDTTLGSFKIELFASETPVTVNNFVFLARQNYYNGVIFHRIIKEFMIQTGDPTGTGAGGPGYRFNDELPVKHDYEPGLVAMANAGTNTNGSQFFICTGESSKNLNYHPNYTQFGRVVEGMETVMKIASVKVVSNGREVSQPVNPPVINSITIIEE